MPAKKKSTEQDLSQVLDLLRAQKQQFQEQQEKTDKLLAQNTALVEQNSRMARSLEEVDRKQAALADNQSQTFEVGRNVGEEAPKAKGKRPATTADDQRVRKKIRNELDA